MDENQERELNEMLWRNGQAWWQNMSEMQKTFWYAARDPQEAESLRRVFVSRVWYRLGLGIVVFLGWLDVLFAPNKGAEIWINIGTMVPLTLMMGWGLYLEFLEPRGEDDSDGKEGVGSDDEPGSSPGNPARFE